MRIYYSENDSEETEILLHEGTNSISLKGLETRDIYLDVIFPFKLSKISPQYKVLDDLQEEILVFRNNNFSEYDICEIRNFEGNKIGLLFKPSMIFDDDASYLFKDNKILQVSIFRSFLNLMKGNLSLEPDRIKVEREVDYSFENFIPQDVIFGVFPHEWNATFDVSVITEMFINLHLYGFYYLNNQKDFDFKPPQSQFQSLNFNTLIANKHHSMPIKLLSMSAKVKSNPYCYHYITSIVKENSNAVAKFHQIYGLIEIFKDEILKLEIADKICSKRMNSSGTGHQIHQEIIEMSRDLYNINKLFSKYSKTSSDNLETILYEIYFFLDLYRDPKDIKEITQFPQAYYYLRNIIVHDIQFLFTGDEERIEKMSQDFSKLIIRIEFLIIETLCYLKI